MLPSRQELLEDEWLIVRHSGEIPEITLHSAFYYLTEDPEGPRLQLSVEEIQYLQEAAATRYQEIILRDLCYENLELTIYRGVRRAIFNWHRSVAFCERQKTSCPNLRRITAEALLLLVKKVLQRRDKVDSIPGRSSAVPGSNTTEPGTAFVFNCTFHDITLFARELGIKEEQLPEDIRLLCDK